jgi:hypothetical protein
MNEFYLGPLQSSGDRHMLACLGHHPLVMCPYTYRQQGGICAGGHLF